MKTRRRGLLADLRYLSEAAQDCMWYRHPDDVRPVQAWIRAVEREIAALLREHPKRPANMSDPTFPRGGLYR